MSFALLTLVFLLSAAAASLGNAAVYEFAWNARRVSPWQPAAEGVAQRNGLDRVPILGWLRLRRDHKVLGRGFWVRPLLVELGFATAMTWLAWWEVLRAGLVTPQIGAPLDAASLATPLLATLAAHLVLAWLMLVASLIDVDEKTIPDAITVPGTLLGLLLIALLPGGHLPNVEARYTAPAVGVPLQTGGKPLDDGLGNNVWLEPTHVTAPLDWPATLVGGQGHGVSLGIGLGCYALWCFALTPRYWRTRHGYARGLGLLLRRVGRSLRTRPLREIFLGGVLGITTVWFTGGAAWQGLLTALVGMVLAGAIVWSVRIIGSLALGREAMGFGDVTLMMMVGTFVGWQAGLLTFFLAPFAGLVVGIAQLVLCRDDEIPYGPFLCLATAAIVVRWGHVWPEAEKLFALGWIVPVVLLICLVMLGVLLGIWRVIKQRLLGMGDA
ncbi:prepilin peptidase [Botrimarina hoheduenensis]|uniref:Type IV leader peptidase family protein n=1 Tax=Botrimarina hoheduenensis TaxID=2528000 RepID=A0A5C5WBN6_9BACT|nr:A24 family peptidase [Botrimarina hoheduenensis]TWT48316.1 Type IV leader peptidase family protein [Botrimarina hoheduenensis]